jgi:tetratricopeptide (TPR) repeat protein
MTAQVYLAIALLAGMAAPAVAGTNQPGTDPAISQCEAKSPPDIIAGCSKILDAGQEMGAYLFEAYANRAGAELAELQPQAAAADASKAIALNPENAKIYVTRAAAEVAQNDFAAAIADTTRSLALEPSAQARSLRGKAEGAAGDWGKDDADQTAALALDADFVHAYWLRALAEQVLHDFPASDADLQKFLAAKPDDLPALNARAAGLVQVDKPEAAIAVIQHALALDPADGSAAVSLGLAYGERDDWLQEVAQLNKTQATVRLSPHELFFLYANRALAEQHADSFPAAIKDATAALALDPQNAGLYVLRAGSYQQTGDYRAEIADDARAIALAPSDPAAYGDRATAYELQLQYAKAIPDESKLIALEPKNALVWNNRCWDRAHTGNLQGALADCQQAVKLAPKDGTILDSLGYVYLKLHQDAQAITTYNAALQDDPNQASSIYGRGLAERAARELEAAQADIAQALQLDPGVAKQF